MRMPQNEMYIYYAYHSLLDYRFQESTSACLVFWPMAGSFWNLVSGPVRELDGCVWDVDIRGRKVDRCGRNADECICGVNEPICEVDGLLWVGISRNL